MKAMKLLLLPCLLVSCLPGPDGEKAEEAEIRITGSLPVSCPLAVTCDEHWEYRAYAGQADSLSFYFSFEPAFALARTDADAKSLFTYMYFSVDYPSLATDSSRTSFNVWAVPGTPHDSAGLYHRIDSFSGDTLRGTIRTTIGGLTERIESREPACSSGDILGICYRYHQVEPQIVTIRYALRLVHEP